MNFGKFRHRITIQTNTQTVDANGGLVNSWDHNSNLWASIKPLSGEMSFDIKQMFPHATHEIHLRHQQTTGIQITTKNRILYGTRVFNIININNIEERNRELMIIAEEISA